MIFRHPVRLDDVHEEWHPGGETIAELLDHPAVTPSILVMADGELIESDRWDRVMPRHHLVIRRVPANRNVLYSIAAIALAIFAPYLGSTITIALGQGATWSYVWTAAVTVVGSLAINALVPPVVPDIEGAGGTTRLNAITGQSNQVASFSPIPKVYGNPTYYPPIPMTGLPFTELVGEDQYIRMLVVLGYGKLDIGGVTVGAGESLMTEASSWTGDPIKIGGTAIDQFSDVEFEIGDPDDVTLFTDTIVETAVNVPLNHSGDPTTENQTIVENVQVVETTETNTDEVSGDIYFPQLYSISGQGNTRYVTVNFQVHYSVAGAGSYTLAKSFAVSSIERKPLRRGFHFKLPSTGQWDIRLTRVSTFYQQENSFFSDATWTVLRSIKRNVKPFDVDDTVVMALRIRATDQLGGRIDRLSVSATSILPAWNGSSWVDTVTRSPTWAYVDMFCGVGTRSAQALSKTETDALKSAADWQSTEGLYFDQVIDADGTVLDRAREALSAGLASWHVTDTGLYSVVRDQTQSPKAVVTPRNSFDFSTQYKFQTLPHALRVTFMDPTRWEPTQRIVYADGYNADGSGGKTAATRFEELQTVGVWDSDQAWKIGRYHLAQIELRPEIHSFSQDIQHLVYQRGETVELAHDVILVGLKYGRITGITLNGSNEVTSADVDELLLMSAGPTYALKIQRKDGTIITETIATVTPSTQTVTFSTPIVQHDYGSGNESGIQVGDHFTFGESGSESFEVKISAIRPLGDFKAAVTAVPAAETIFDAWTGGIPTFDPVLTAPIDTDLLPPIQPSIVSIRFDSPPGPDGTPKFRMAIAFDMPPGLTGVYVQSRVRGFETISSVDHASVYVYDEVRSDAGVIYVNEIEFDHEYQVEIRSRKGQRFSDWTATQLVDAVVDGWPSQGKAEINLMPFQFSDFEVGDRTDYFYPGSGTLELVTSQAYLGYRSLKFTFPAATFLKVHESFGLGPGNDTTFPSTVTEQTEYNIHVEPGRKYLLIARLYAHNDEARHVRINPVMLVALGSGGTPQYISQTGVWEQHRWLLDLTASTDRLLILAWTMYDYVNSGDTPAQIGWDLIDLRDITDTPEFGKPTTEYERSEMLTNIDFETAAFSPHVQTESGATWRISSTAGEVLEGTYSAVFDPSGQSGEASLLLEGGQIPVTAGEDYQLVLAIRRSGLDGSSLNDMRLELEWLDSGGSVISTTTTSIDGITDTFGGGSIHYYAVTGTAPGTAVSVNAQLIIENTGRTGDLLVDLLTMMEIS